jgi:hypothetical protein
VTTSESLPTELAAAHAMILAERAARMEAQAEAARALAVNSSTEALIAHLKLEIEKLRRELYGSRSERKTRLLDQMEWPAAGSVDTEIRCFMEREGSHAEKDIQPRVQA